MIYLDNGATSLPKAPGVVEAVKNAMASAASSGRGGYGAAFEASNLVYACREAAGNLFDCKPEEVAMTFNATHGLNIAIRTLVPPGGRVVISGFEHNAVVRPLYALGAKIKVAGRRLFSWENTLEEFRRALSRGADAAVFTQVSNVFGYILPVEEISALCREFSVPFIVDASQAAGVYPVKLRSWGADFIAMPGHKGLLGPQGTGLLLCGRSPEPLLLGGTGGQSLSREMPEDGPERVEAGTLNIPGIAGLAAGMEYIKARGLSSIRLQEETHRQCLVSGLRNRGMKVFTGPHQGGTVSFIPGEDVEEAAQRLSDLGFALRAGFHCAPVAHESAGTLGAGTIRVSPGPFTCREEIEAFIHALSRLRPYA